MRRTFGGTGRRSTLYSVRTRDRNLGLGVGLDDVGNTRYAWQWGANSGFKHIYLADPQNEKAVAVFTNGDRGIPLIDSRSYP